MGAAGASPATRSGERRPGDGGATLPPGRPVARGAQLGPASPPALRFVPTGHSSPTTASAPKLTPAGRGGAAAPRPPPTPGRCRPASCPRRGCRPELHEGGQTSRGSALSGDCDNARSVGVPTGHLLLHTAPNSAGFGPHGEQGHTQPGFPWIGSAEARV